MKLLVIVPGYGCNREKVENYYSEIAHLCLGEINNGKNVTIISCGGYTDPQFHPGISEAGLGQEIMRPLIKGTPIYLEDRSWTTIENLLFSDALIRYLVSRENYEFHKIVIFCDSIRVFKMKVLAEFILGTMFRRPIYIFGIDLKRTTKEKIIQWLVKTPLEIVDGLLHLPGQIMTAQRFHQWNLSGHKD